MSGPQKQYTATTFAGLENVLAAELAELGASDLEIARRAVSFKGSEVLMYKCNLHLRTALNVLQHISTFKVQSDDMLYKEISKTDWSRFLSTDSTFAIDATVSESNLNHSKYAALKAKDAIVDQFRNKTGKRPSIDTETPDLRIYLHIHNNVCRLFFNSSGSSLHYRNYRMESGHAPLNEVLAAGLIKLSEWNAREPFLDFMCGSGTLLIEAAMISRNIPAGFFRSRFGFETWFDFDKQLWDRIWSEAKAAILPHAQSRITGGDIDYQMVNVCRGNLEAAGLQNDVTVICESFDKLKEKLLTDSVGGVIVVNPPYDKRLATGDDVAFHKQIGDVLKHQYGGWRAFVFTGNMEAAKFIGLRPSRKIHLFNGKLECRLLRFDLWEHKKHS